MKRKWIDFTPPQYRCDYLGVGCPTVRGNGQTYLITGKQVSDADYPELKGRIGPDEAAVEIPAELLDQVVKLSSAGDCCATCQNGTVVQSARISCVFDNEGDIDQDVTRSASDCCTRHQQKTVKP